MTTNWQIRPAQEYDFPAIRQLIHQSNINPMGVDWRRFLIAVDNDENLLGCGQIKPHRDGSRELASIAVVPERRGEGIARGIIERLLGKETGILFLTCRSQLAPLYEKFGFRSTLDLEEMPAYFRNLSRLVSLFQKTGVMPGKMLVMVRKPDYDRPITNGGS